jgi:SOS-response transcriptional repressor LexA
VSANHRFKIPTARQARVLHFIARSVAEHGFPPTVREIADHLGINSTNGSTDHLRALARKGMVKVTPITARGMALTDAGRDYLREHPEPSSAPAVSESITRASIGETEGQ